MLRKIYPWRRKSRYQISQAIFNKLINYPFGATVSILSRDLKLTRKVIREELRKLYAIQKVKLLKIGNAKLYMRKKYAKRIKW